MRGLRWRNVDLEKGSIHICERMNTRNKFGPPKSEAGTRDIPLPDTVVTILTEWKKVCSKSDDDLVFPNGAGNVEYHQNILNRCFFPL
ncbi:hypothetical protein J1W56_15585 [Phyllobacterium sp. R2-JL]|nr:hypothetical protein [Phyllobacterium calauticae]